MYIYTSISTRATHGRTNIFCGVNKLLLWTYHQNKNI